jgi:hypothetical protein
MTEKFEKIGSDDLLHVVGHRGAVNHKLGSVLLQLSVATTEDELTNPKTMMLSIRHEYVDELVSSLQQAASILRQSN